MKNIVLSAVIIVFIIPFISCGHQKNKESDTTQTNIVDVEKVKQEILNRDIEFANYSEKNGMKEAFINYIADNGVLLRPNHKPIIGKDSVSGSMNKNNKVTIKWAPLFADVSISGDLGYTYGTYTSTTMAKGQTVTSSGTYVTIWKKDKEGIWKFVLDSGNEGLIPLNRKGK
jgi:ketosteroid isomerase-like protein